MHTAKYLYTCAYTSGSSSWYSSSMVPYKYMYEEGKPEQILHTVDREIFTLKIIRVKIFHDIKFLWFHSICNIILTADDCNMDERLESSWCLVY